MKGNPKIPAYLESIWHCPGLFKVPYQIKVFLKFLCVWIVWIPLWWNWLVRPSKKNSSFSCKLTSGFSFYGDLEMSSCTNELVQVFVPLKIQFQFLRRKINFYLFYLLIRGLNILLSNYFLLFLFYLVALKNWLIGIIYIIVFWCHIVSSKSNF